MAQIIVYASTNQMVSQAPMNPLAINKTTTVQTAMVRHKK
jgi:hypothetical protein